MRAYFFIFLFLNLFLFAQESFLLVNAHTNETFVKVGSDIKRQVTPCCTFNIALSLMGFDSGIFQNQEEPVWDFQVGYVDDIETWRAPHNPELWIKNSCVWYSQLLAEMLGTDRVQNYLEILDYGNKDLSGGIDSFWLGSTLKIAPYQQIKLLQKILFGDLPFSSNSIEKAKSLFFREELAFGWKLFGKTGYGTDGDQKVGWFVGWMERGDDLYIFSYNNLDITVDPYGSVPRAKELLMDAISKERTSL